MGASHTTLFTNTSVTLVRDFEVRFEGAVVPVPPIAQRVLCFLALQDRPVRRPYVSGCLWPDVDEQRAAARLRTALWRVPSPGGSSMLCASSTHLCLDASVTVDLPRLVEDSVERFGSGTPPPDASEVARVLWLYGQDLLDGWYDEWAIAERERFRQLRLHVLEHVGEALFAVGRHREALQVALSVVATEPLRESAYRLLLRAHLGEGNVAEALRQYRRFAEHLQQEIGVAPTRAMTELVAPYRLASTWNSA